MEKIIRKMINSKIPYVIAEVGSNHLGKKKLAHDSFKNNIESWHEEYLNNGLDAIISNT